MQRTEITFKRNLAEAITINPENYSYCQSLSVGIAIVFFKFLIDQLILEKENFEIPILTFAVSFYCALYYFTRGDETVSFKNYKINYSHSLGKGGFGNVYALVPRPENERGYLSNLFPYIYDYYFPVTDHNYVGKYSNNDDVEKYCVKIYSFRVSPHCILDYTRDRLEEKQSNKMLSNAGMTNVKFYTSNCLFSQIKTRIHGKTLGWHLTNNSFVAPKNYKLREKFVLFYRSLSYSNMIFQDMNPGNIMYDEQKKQWEIIDGIVEDNNKKENIAYKFFSRYLRSYEGTSFLEKFDSAMSFLFQNDENSVFMLLRESALSRVEYTKEKDAEILERCSEQLLSVNKSNLKT